MERSNVIRVLRLLVVLSVVSSGASPVSGGWMDDASSISEPVYTLVCTVLYVALINIAGALGAVVFVFAGVQYIIATDDPGKRKASKDLMIYAIVGILIVALGESIVDTVAGALSPHHTGCID